MRLSAALCTTNICLTLGVVACSKENKAPEPQKKSVAIATPSSPPAESEAALPTPPSQLGRIKVPDDNPITPAKVKLGHQLFFDKRLSVDGSMACISCHLNEDGTGGHEPIAIGPKDNKLTRHAPIMWNVAYLPRFYWDGRSESLEDQAKAAWAGGNMGVGEENLDAKAREIADIEDYRRQFEEVFPADGVTAGTIVQALATYERTLFCGDTQFDKFDGGNQSALNDEQKKGWALFTGKAGCNNCHTPPFFSDAYATEAGAYHNTGRGIEGKKENEVDVGRMKVTENPSDWAAFKTPSLRNITKSAPYFHDGSAKTLEEAVRFMASGGYKNKNRDPKLEDKKLSDEEINSLIAFLGSLECPGKLEEPRKP